MKQISTSIEINAPATRVWQVLTDFAAYPEWNPFVREIKSQGPLQEGAQLQVSLGAPGARPMSFRPSVLQAQPDHELRWLGRLLLPGFFDGEHRFVIEKLGENRVQFEQTEVFRGVLVKLFAASLSGDTKRGFEAMNRALKTRVESLETHSRRD